MAHGKRKLKVTQSIVAWGVGVADGPWRGVFNYFAGVADAKPAAADYAISVRKLYDALVVEETSRDAELLRECLLLLVWEQLRDGVISKQHNGLVDKLLAAPTPPVRGSGRPKGAFGKAAHNKRYELYKDWIHEKTLDPSLTKEQFAKKRLSITDEDLEGEYESDHRLKLDALLQDLKPARMKSLDAGQREGLELVYRLLLTEPRHLAQKWQEAKQHSPALTKDVFLRDYFGLPRDRKGHPADDNNLIAVYLETLDRGEKLLTKGAPG